MVEDSTMPSSAILILPVLPLRDLVVLPRMIAPLFVGREKSINALKKAMENDQRIVLLTQKHSSVDDVTIDDLYEIGTLAKILQLLRLNDGTIKVLIEGESRVKISHFEDSEGFCTATFEIIPEPTEYNTKDVAILKRAALGQFEQYLKISTKLSPDILTFISRIDDPVKMMDSITSHVPLTIAEKQTLLEETDLQKRYEQLCEFLEAENSVVTAEKKIRKRVKKQMEKTQREYYLTEQMKAIQKELSETNEGENEADNLENKLKKLKLPKEAKTKAAAELRKLRNMSPMSSEATVVRNYLEWIIDLPWNKFAKTKTDLVQAKEILDKDHYGMEKVKERVIEYLAVQKRVGKLQGPVLCLLGPPGVGKTSLARSIAQSTGRPFIKISLGGVRDEADIRGHRRTYIGSMPGKIIQAMKKSEHSNPLILLDEIDKLGSDYRGDPSSALLEVLDPSQNLQFNDHYLELDYDLSNVMFVTTANTLNMPSPLRDRLEIITVSGYTEDEKVVIAGQHLIPKQMQTHGLEKNEFQIDTDAIYEIVRKYTKESGVRNLEREVAKLARKSVTEITTTPSTSVAITVDTLSKYLGVEKYDFGQAEKQDAVGIVTGLAWTEVGGELLTIEALILPGKGNIKLTGKLGEVMQESIQAALSVVKSRAIEYGIEPTIFEKRDIHIHVPEGAIPKDGPSAGIGMATALVSALTSIPVHKNVAMTGEINLRGQVMTIGGLKEKLLAAQRGGITKVLIPQGNKKHLADIPDNVKQTLEIIAVDTIDQVLQHALTCPTKAIIWKENINFNAAHEADVNIVAH